MPRLAPLLAFVAAAGVVHLAASQVNIDSTYEFLNGLTVSLPPGMSSASVGGGLAACRWSPPSTHVVF